MRIVLRSSSEICAMVTTRWSQSLGSNQNITSTEPIMPLSTDVQLSINVRPKFPKRCIVCSGRSPDSETGVGDLTVGWFSFFTDIPEGWGTVMVPIHSACRKPFKLRRWITRIGYLALACVLWWLFGEQIEAILPEIMRRPGRKVLLVAMMLPVLILEMFNPPRFDITVGKYYVTFEFADKRYAAAFARKNNELKRYEEIKSEM